MAMTVGEYCPPSGLEILPSEQHITLLHPPGYDYFRLLPLQIALGPRRQQYSTRSND